MNISDESPLVKARDLATLAGSALFDKEYYVSQCPHLMGKNVDLISHYLLVGRLQGKTPNPDFGPALNIQTNKKHLKDGEDPFLHYLTVGAQAGLKLRETTEQELHEIPSFRYRVLNSTLINWTKEETKQRNPKLTSVVIPVFNEPELTEECIFSLYQHTPSDAFELLVVDNGSDLHTRQLLQSLEEQHENLNLLRLEENLYFALGCNLGFAAARGETVVFLNNDTRLTNGWLDPLVEALKVEEISAVQPQLCYPDGAIQCMGVVFSEKSPLGYPIYQGMHPEPEWAGYSRAFQAVTGACMALRAQDFAHLRGFDPVYINGQEDVDLCLRLNQLNERHCWLAANSKVIHVGEASVGRFYHVIHNRKQFISSRKSLISADDIENYTSDNFQVVDWKLDSENNKKNGVEIYLPKLQRTGADNDQEFCKERQHSYDQIMQDNLRTLPFDLSGFEKVLQFAPKALVPVHGEYTSARLRICWVVPHFGIGNGGRMTIFRIAKLLENFGHEIEIWVHSQSDKNLESPKYDSLIRKHYQAIDARVYMLGASDHALNRVSGDVVIATDRMSVYPVMAMRHFRRRFYFVQDYEPAFYPVSTEYYLTKNTYSQGLDCLCASEWLKDLISTRHKQWAIAWPLAVDHSVYKHSGAQRVAKQIAFYTRRRTPRRLVELGFLALLELFARGHRFQVVMFGDDKEVPATPYLTINRGVLDSEQLKKLYNESSVGLVFSGTNYSLIPNEMMACGLPLVDLRGENTDLAFGKDTVCRAEPEFRDIADKLELLLTDHTHWSQRQKNGLNYIAQFSWENSAKVIEQAIVKRLNETQGLHNSQQVQSGAQYYASVVIPSYNGGDLLDQVLDAVLSQVTPWHFEILVIDSGSTDGSLERIRTREGIRLHEIANEDFGHGRTRNLGVELTSGEYVAYLTQDALPTSCYWLMNLVSTLESEPDCAGAFGKHVAYPDHSPFIKLDMARYFDEWIGRGPAALYKATDKRKFLEDQAWRKRCHAFSNNNSCLRRASWLDVPFQDVVYGEDQLWALDVLEAGYGKVYVNDAEVYHSHDYSFRETLRRSITEGLYFKKHFDYDLCNGKQAAREMLSRINQRDMEHAKDYGIPEDILKRRKNSILRG